MTKRQLIAQAIPNISFPAISTHYKSQNVPLAAELEIAKREVVSKLLPHITDEEAKQALGPWYTADKVRERSIPPEFFIP